MGKVGIMSMQRIFNYGSFLQSYGLKKMLEELGAHVEFVDYHPGPTVAISTKKNGLFRKVEKALETFQIKTSVRNKVGFINFKRSYAKKYLPVLGIGEVYNYSPHLDLLIIGSDEVFNCVQSNPNVGFSADLFAQNQKAERIVSYAASFGNTTYEKLVTAEVDEKVSTWLGSFNSLSVRDENSKKIIKKLANKSPEKHVDPVIAYDFIKKESLPNVNTKNPYLLLYGYTGRFSREECVEITKFANEHNLEILCIGGIQNGGSAFRFINCSPLEVISYFQNAQYVITDTFHGTILSVIAHKSFVTIVRKSGYGNVEKILDLLKILELTERQLLSLENIDQVIFNKIDYFAVDHIIQTERNRTYDYLKEELARVH